MDILLLRRITPCSPGEEVLLLGSLRVSPGSETPSDLTLRRREPLYLDMNLTSSTICEPRSLKHDEKCDSSSYQNGCRGCEYPCSTQESSVRESRTSIEKPGRLWNLPGSAMLFCLLLSHYHAGTHLASFGRSKSVEVHTVRYELSIMVIRVPDESMEPWHLLTFCKGVHYPSCQIEYL